MTQLVWKKYNGELYLQMDNGRADFMLSDDGTKIYSVNQSSRPIQPEQIRWSIDPTYYMSDDDKAVYGAFQERGLIK